MKLPTFDYKKPQSLDDAVALLAEKENPRLMGGGSDVLFNMKLRLMAPQTLISLDGIPDLKGIEQTEQNKFILGSGCRLADLARHDGLRKHSPLLIDAIQSVASWHIRNHATLGGNLCLDTRCWYTNQSEEWRNGRETCFKTDGDICHVIKSSPICVALNSSDLAPALIVLGADIVLRSQEGERRLPLSAFYQLDGVDHTKRKDDEILSHVILNPCDDALAYIKIAPRKGMDFSHGTIAARVSFENETIANAHFVIGSMTPEPISLQHVTDFLIGTTLDGHVINDAADRALEDMGVLTNLYTSSAHKKDLVLALVKKALRQLAKAHS